MRTWSTSSLDVNAVVSSQHSWQGNHPTKIKWSHSKSEMSTRDLWSWQCSLDFKHDMTYMMSPKCLSEGKVLQCLTMSYNPHNLCPGNAMIALGPSLPSPHIIGTKLSPLCLQPWLVLATHLTVQLVLVVLIWCFYTILLHPHTQVDLDLDTELVQ